MGNIITSFISGFAKVVGKLFGSPLDFLAGKSCSSVCGSTWDFFCYIENFCVANLLKMAMVLVLFYIVLLFFYLLHKLGICYCIGHSLCKITWACWYSLWECCCIFLCDNLLMLRRRSHDHIRDWPKTMEVTRSLSRRGRRIRKSLRPRSHRIQVVVTKPRRHVLAGADHHIRVTHSSKFAHKRHKQ